MAIRRMLRVFSRGVLTIAVACGGRVSDASSTTEGAIDRDELITQLQGAICATADRCCTLAGWTPGADCIDAVERRWRPVIDYARAVGASFDGHRARLCVEVARSEWQLCRPFKAYTSQLETTCARVFSAPFQMPPGQPCEASLDCAGDEAAVGTCLLLGDETGVNGTCVNTVLSQVGEPCGGIRDNTNWKCLAPNVCGEDLRCRTPFSIGQACDHLGGDTCAESAVCAVKPASICRVARSPDEPCTTDDQCENFACIAGRCRVYPDLQLAWYCQARLP